MNASAMKLRDHITPQVGRELALVIGESVVETIEIMFGQKISMDQLAADFTPERAIAANMVLRQGDETARLRMLFDRELIQRLVSGFYPAEMLANDAVLQDAACEISNIVCNRVKLYLNTRGLDVALGLPFADSDAPAPGNDDIVNLHFTPVSEKSARGGNNLRIDFRIDGRRAS
jgi:hypothetical protein